MLTVVPAYGRDYESAKAALADWNDNKDFIVATISSPYDGKYCNKQDLPNEQVKIRYHKLTKCVITKD